MNKIRILTSAIALSFGASFLSAGVVANISWGSEVAQGGAQYFGEDSLAADSIALGYFTADSVDATGLSGWNEFASYSTFPTGGWSNPASLTNVDTTAAEGLTAYMLITDGSLQAIVRLNSWAALTGATSPAPATPLSYLIGATDSAANITSFAASGTSLSIVDGEGIDFGSGGFSGTGVSFNLTAVPEPSSYALIAGAFGLTCVIVRRRK